MRWSWREAGLGEVKNFQDGDRGTRGRWCSECVVGTGEFVKPGDLDSCADKFGK